MGICKCFSSPKIVKCLAIIIPKRKSLGAAYSSSSSHHNYRNISPKDLGPHLKEKNWAADHQEKIREIKQVLLENLDRDEEMDKKENLILVDAIQRVGIDRHFDEEIEIILGRHYNNATNNNLFYFINDDLYYVSLYFRLLRNQGHYVSADVFDGFKGNDGKFKEKLGQDIRGLMEFHEASQLRFIDEDIIDGAEEFSRVNLNKCLGNTSSIDDWHKNLIRNTLRNPQHKNIARLNARNYIDGGFVEGCKKGWGKTLIELAKMDVLMGELLHKEEFLQISKWWGNVGIAEELQRARNQPMKWYIWSMAILIDYPSLQVQRIELTKAIAFVYLIDDIFDLYGNLNELTLFTQAIYRWEYGANDTLPEYMRNSYRALLDTTNDIAQKVEKMYGINPIDSLKETWGSLCRAFLVEARWFRSRELPRAKEYLENGQVSSGVHVILVHLFFLLGLGRGHSSIHLNDTSTLVSSIATILRLSDDLGSAKDEQQDGWDGSYIKCCMNDVPKLSVKEARENVEEMISKQWKNLNKECFLHLNQTNHCFRRASLNAARMVPLMYTYDQNQKLMLLQQHVDTSKLL
ncbi:hypothetical protein C2S52_007035 [Perilla frutescens var. hirtella]|nr:hypothetical protein C2S52_007035 [Perilla frutescens var. hirtella]